MIRPALVSLILLLNTVCLSAPSISSYSGTATDGESIVISGTDFTTHADFNGGKDWLAARWHDWDNNNLLDTDQFYLYEDHPSEWSVESGGRTNSLYYAERQYLSEVQAGMRFATTTATDTTYTTFWFMVNDNVTSGKLWRHWFGAPGGSNVIDHAYFTGGTNLQLRGQPDGTLPYAGTFYGDGSDSFVSDQWHRVEILSVYIANGQSDNGTVTVWVDGVSRMSKTDWFDSTEYPGTYAPTDGVISLAEIKDAGSGVNAYNYDDYYVSFTQARVEVGDNAVFGNCTQKEIQIPTAWGATETTVTVNTGAFTSEDIYLFVIDSDGVASSGYAIASGPGNTTIGSGVPISIDSTAPTVSVY